MKIPLCFPLDGQILFSPDLGLSVLESLENVRLDIENMTVVVRVGVLWVDAYSDAAPFGDETNLVVMEKEDADALGIPWSEGFVALPLWLDDSGWAAIEERYA